MNVEIGAEAEQFPEKELPLQCASHNGICITLGKCHKNDLVSKFFLLVSASVWLLSACIYLYICLHKLAGCLCLLVLSASICLCLLVSGGVCLCLLSSTCFCLCLRYFCLLLTAFSAYAWLCLLVFVSAWVQVCFCFCLLLSIFSVSAGVWLSEHQESCIVQRKKRLFTY
jgi:hypothetical protein